MKIEELKSLLDSGNFHHATYRNFNTLWEGLWIYKKDSRFPLGFDAAGVFYKNDPNLKIAETLVRKTGISVGSYGRG